MATLLIILLSTVLIQGSAIASGHHGPATPQVRGVLATELRHALITCVTLPLATLVGFALKRLPADWLISQWQSGLLLLTMASIVTAARLLFWTPVTAWPNTIDYLTNQCALLGMALFSASHATDLWDALVYGVMSALALAMLSASFSALRERVDLGSVPLLFRGIPIALISAGILALGLLGFTGLVRN